MPTRPSDPPEDTEKVPVHPIPPPLPPRIDFPETRLEVAWKLHRQVTDDQFRSFRNEILSAIVAERVPASDPAPPSARQKVMTAVKVGALKGTKWGGYVSLAITALLLVAKALGRTDLATPLEGLGKLLDGGP